MKKVPLQWVFWVLLSSFPLLRGQTYFENREAARLLVRLQIQLEELNGDYNRGLRVSDLDPLRRHLELLEGILRRDAANRLHLTGPAVLEAEARNEILFDQKPKLPPEDKKGGSWSFRASRFQVIPDHLYIFGLKLKGNRTIRLKSVTLCFRKGDKIVHDGWKDLQQGNGQAFSKRGFTPYLPVYHDHQTRRARALKSIEILGSAQDGEFSADLEFVFQIPEPQDIPIKPVIDLIVQMRQSWDSRNIDANRLDQCRKDLARLDRALKTKFGIGDPTPD